MRRGRGIGRRSGRGNGSTTYSRQPELCSSVVDAAPVAAVDPFPPPYVVQPVVGGGGIGILPLLLGLAAIAGAALLLLGGDDDDEIRLPTGP